MSLHSFPNVLGSQLVVPSWLRFFCCFSSVQVKIFLTYSDMPWKAGVPSTKQPKWIVGYCWERTTCDNKALCTKNYMYSMPNAEYKIQIIWALLRTMIYLHGDIPSRSTLKEAVMTSTYWKHSPYWANPSWVRLNCKCNLM